MVCLLALAHNRRAIRKGGSLFFNHELNGLNGLGNMEVKVRVKKADLEKCETQLDFIELVSGEWLKQHPFKRK